MSESEPVNVPDLLRWIKVECAKHGRQDMEASAVELLGRIISRSGDARDVRMCVQSLLGVEGPPAIRRAAPISPVSKVEQEPPTLF